VLDRAAGSAVWWYLAEGIDAGVPSPRVRLMQDRFARPQQQRGAPGGGDRPSPRQELSAMSSWDARRGGGAGAGDAADRDRFLSAEELEDRERKERQACARACAATPGPSPLCPPTLK